MARPAFSRRSFLHKGLLASAAALAAPGFAQALAAGSSSPAPTPTQPSMADEGAKLPVVFLVGTLHSTAVHQQVERLLKGKASVISPASNCGNSLDVLKNIPGWIKQYNPDLVHISTGFEDVRSIYYGSDDRMVPRSFYKRNLFQIIDLIYGVSDKAVPMWATITPIDDDRLVEAKAKQRDWTCFNDDVLLYNREAAKICRRMKAKVNDLYGTVLDNGAQALLAPNGYDLNGKGVAVVAQQVATSIENYL